jgi:hypothetical protein
MIKNILRFNPHIFFSSTGGPPASGAGSTTVVAGKADGGASSARTMVLGVSSYITGYLGSCSSKYFLLNSTSGFERTWGELSALTSGRLSSCRRPP